MSDLGSLFFSSTTDNQQSAQNNHDALSAFVASIPSDTANEQAPQKEGTDFSDFLLG